MASYGPENIDLTNLFNSCYKTETISGSRFKSLKLHTAFFKHN